MHHVERGFGELQLGIEQHLGARTPVVASALCAELRGAMAGAAPAQTACRDETVWRCGSPRTPAIPASLMTNSNADIVIYGASPGLTSTGTSGQQGVLVLPLGQRW